MNRALSFVDIILGAMSKKRVRRVRREFLFEKHSPFDFVVGTDPRSARA